MISELINLNGEIISAKEPVLHSANRSFRYGDGLFESIRIINGKVMLLDKHLVRLHNGMQVLQMEALEGIENIGSQILELTKVNHAENSGRIRLSVFRNEGGFYTPSDNSVSYLIESEKLNYEGYDFNQTGLVIDIYDEIKKSLNKLSGLKSANSLVYVMAGIWKQKNNLDDCIIVNDKGNLCEAVSSSLFIVRNKELYTPALEEGCVAGIMRECIIELAKENNIPIHETHLNTDILKEADEVFFTNAIKGIQWVGAYKQKRYFNSSAKLLSEKLNIF